MTKIAKCHDCHLPIRFVIMDRTRRRMPVDPTPDDDGNVYAHVVAGELRGHVKTKGEELPPGWATYMPHHATCHGARRRAPRDRRGPVTSLNPHTEKRG